MRSQNLARYFACLGVAALVHLLLAEGSGAGQRSCDSDAVAQLNAEFSAGGGHMSNSPSFDTGWIGSAASGFAAPVFCSFGFQTDSVLEFNGEAWMVGVDGHVFWRNPDLGMIGVTGAYTNLELDDGDLSRLLRAYAGEAELYLDQFTLFVLGGHVGGNGTLDGKLGMAELSWYVTENFRAHAGALYTKGSGTVAKLGLEFRPEFISHPPVSFFADAEIADDDYGKVLAGIRFEIGATGSLKERDRSERLPRNLAQDLTSIAYTYENK